MDAYLLQDWTTRRGATTVGTLTQAETDWLELRTYQDVVGWLEVKEFTPTSGNIPTIAYQTSPSKDDSLFFPMAPPITVTTGVTTTPMLKTAIATTYTPLGRWVRWQIVVSGGVAWDLTFRIWIAANRIGQSVPIAEATALGDLEKEASWFAAGQGPTTSTVTTPVVYQPPPNENGGTTSTKVGTGNLPSAPVTGPLSKP
jgi:hypothetical protein